MRGLITLKNKISTARKLSFKKKQMLLFAFFLSIYSWIMMRFFRKYARFGIQTKEIKKTIPETENTNDEIVKDIRWSIFVINKYTPWENLCRHQAFQAKILLSFYHLPYYIYVGFQKNAEGTVVGHAWTMASDLMITGFCDPNEYLITNIYTNT
jgi:hypothetical protein